MPRPAVAILTAAVALSLGAGASPKQARPASTISADSLRDVVEPLFAAGQYDSILRILPRYIQNAEASSDSLLLGRAIIQRGRVLLMQGRQDAAERDIDLGIHIAESVRDTVGLMPAVHFRGLAYAGVGDYEEAMRCYERRLLLAQRTRSPLDEAWARTAMAFVWHRREQLETARSEYIRAIELFRSNEAPRPEITPLIGLARVESAMGDDREAIRCNQRAWLLATEVGDRVNEMWAANNLGALEYAIGDLSQAAQYARRAFELARELKSPHAMVIPAINMAARAQELGDFETAERVLEETRAMCETQGAREHITTVDLHVAELRMNQNRRHAAAALLRRLDASAELSAPQHRDRVVLNLARVLAWSDSVDAAIDLVSQHLNRPGRRAYGDAIADANILLASLHLQRDDEQAALARALQAREAAERVKTPRVMIAAMLRESVCRRAVGQSEEAAAMLHEALDSLEAYRGGITTADWREVYGQKVAQGVVEAARVLLEYPESATQAARSEAFFNAMQRVKSRALIDRITEPRFGTAGIEGRWSTRVASLRDLQSVLRPGEAALDFSVAIHRSFVAAVTADSLRLLELPGPDTPLAERVHLFRRILASTDASLRVQYPAERLELMQRALGREILEGVADIVDRSETLFVSTDGFFSDLPFGALMTGDVGGALLTARDVVQVPSTSVLVLQRAIETTECVDDPAVVAIGSPEPRLPGARDEVRELARFYRGVDRVAELPDIDAFESVIRDCDVLHIAAHALVVDRSPWESGIRLVGSGEAERTVQPDVPAPTRSSILSEADSLRVARTFRSDPYVRAWQIAKLRLPARLAVLSGCETGGGRVTTGEGTLGITAAFLSAGVPVVVSSLWPIDDRATVSVMRSFYRNLAADKPVATALRLAQLEVSRSSRYAHPFYWAGFIVVGDGTVVIDVEERPFRRRLVVALTGVAIAAAALLTVFWRRRLRTPVR